MTYLKRYVCICQVFLKDVLKYAVDRVQIKRHCTVSASTTGNKLTFNACLSRMFLPNIHKTDRTCITVTSLTFKAFLRF